MTVTLSRRGFLGAIIAAAVAPAIIRTSGLLMPVKPGLVSVPVPKIINLLLPRIMAAIQSEIGAGYAPRALFANDSAYNQIAAEVRALTIFPVGDGHASRDLRVHGVPVLVAGVDGGALVGSVTLETERRNLTFFAVQGAVSQNRLTTIEA